MIELFLFSIYLAIATSFILTFITFLAGNKYKTFVIFNISLFPYYFCYAIMVTTNDPWLALLCAKICIGFPVIIALSALIFGLEYSGYRIKKWLIYSNISFGLIFYILVFTTSFFVTGLEPFLDFNFSANTTLAYKIIFPIYYIANVIVAHIFIFKSIKKNPKAKYTFIGYSTGFAGGSMTLFPFFDISIYPLGNFTVIIYCIFMAYGILGRGLFDSSVVITKGIARFFAITVLGALYFVMTYFYNSLFPERSGFFVENFANILFLLIVGESYQFLMKKFQNVQENIFKKPYKYEKISNKIDQKLSQVTDIDALKSALVDIFYNDLKLALRLVAVNTNWILDKKDEPRSNLLEVVYSKENFPSESVNENINNLAKVKNAAIYYELDTTIKNLMDKTISSAIVPIIFGSEFLGCILVKQRSKTHYFDHNDFLIFDSLVFQVGNAIDRVRSYNKLVNLEAEKIKAESYKSLAGSIAHEIRNPLNTINIAGKEIDSILDYRENELMEECSSRKTMDDFDYKSKLENIKKLAQDNIKNSGNQNDNYNILSKYRKNKKELSSLTSKISDSIYLANNIINIILSDLKDQSIPEEDFEYINITQFLPEIIAKYGYKTSFERNCVSCDIALQNSTDLNKTKDVVIKATKERFTFILYNLIKNALYYKFDYMNLKIAINLEEIVVNKKSYVVINVTDYNGPGVSEEIMPKLFDDFYSDNKKSGTGLGLAFCKRNMKIFGGDITCESKLGKYTKFSLFFPKLSKEELRGIGNKKKKRILLINIDKKTQDIIEDNLDVVCDNFESSNPELLQEINKTKYKLVLFDYNKDDSLGRKLRNIYNLDKSTPFLSFAKEDYENWPQDVKELLFYHVKRNDEQEISDFGTTNNQRILLRNIAKLLNTNPNNEEDLLYLPEIRDLKNHKVILADDNEINLRVTKNALASLGLDITTASDGKELLEIFKADLEKTQRSSFDMIITDINMPYLGGNKAAKEIRKIENNLGINLTNQIPIIVTTGNIINTAYEENRDNNINNYFSSAINDYFVKANNPDMLVKIIGLYLGL